MEFQEILADTPITVGVTCIPIIMVTVAFVIGTFMAFSELKDRLEKDTRSSKDIRNMTITMISCFLAACMFAVSFFVVIEASNKTFADNDETLKSNIATKYEVDEVKLKFGETITVAESHETQSVHVVVDDVTYEFYLTQDNKTWEPTLSNPAVRGGSSDTQNLSAEDILK